MSLDDDIAALFAAYAVAWEAEDADAVADFYVVPQLLVDERGTVFIEDDAALFAGIEAELAIWRTRGHGKVTASVTALTPLPDDAVRAFVDWTIDGKGDGPPVRFAAIYSLVEMAGKWAIVTTDITDLRRVLGGTGLN